MSELAGHAFTVADGGVLRCECGWRRPLPLQRGKSSTLRAWAIKSAILQHEIEVRHEHDQRGPRLLTTPIMPT